jgi:hypothetical protein
MNEKEREDVNTKKEEDPIIVLVRAINNIRREIFKLNFPKKEDGFKGSGGGP